VAVGALAASACSSSPATISDDQGASEDPTSAPMDETEMAAVPAEPAAVSVVPGQSRSFPPAPTTISGPLHPDDAATIQAMNASISVGFGSDLVKQLEANGDARLLWVLSDWLRFLQNSDLGSAMLRAAEVLAEVDFDDFDAWGDLTDHLIAWDLAAPPDYQDYKAFVFTTVDERWDFVFADPDADIDYRLLSWGGVFIDDRALGDPNSCSRGCIPALDDPPLTAADEGDWYPDDAVVFGVEINGESVAFPKNIMEIHEMVNTTIGGRRVAMPYCTLCGSAQVFFTDGVAGVDRPPVLRTSGLLSRSNKVMYDLDSLSVFDTFSGNAVSGPLRAAGVTLPQAAVVTTTWLDWRTSHRDTQIVAEDGGLGRTYPLDPLDGRDDDGPIFPIGQVDDRLEVQAAVLGIDTPNGQFVAFPVEATRATLQNGLPVELGDIAVMLDGEGLVASLAGEPIASHQAFWFAWSQFHPDTALWLPDS